MKKNEPIGRFIFNPLKKTFLIMRITILLLLFSFLQANANNAYSQKTKFSIKFSNAELVTVLDKIENQTDFFFLYNEKLIDTNRKVSINATDQKIEEVLTTLFEGTNVEFSIIDRKIILAPSEFSSTQQPEKTVSGTITDNTGQPIPGVTVVVKGTNTGVVTGFDGKYSIGNISANSSLQFSFVGLKTQELTVGNKSSINIVMEEETVGIEEVVAIGYGTKKKVNLTGSVASVGSVDIVKRPAHSVGNLLQGKVTGLQIVQQSGEPGNDNPVIRIRGMGTFSGAGSDPLVLVDGVQGDLSKLNPENIESVSVLKDAASASIYGARAANGVILVTTKQGKLGELNIEYSGNYQIQQPTRMPKFVTNSANFMTDWNYANQRANQPNYFSQAEIDAFRNSNDPIKYPNYNWMDHMIGNGAEQNHYLSLNGGNEKTRFNVSLGLTDQTGINDAFTYKKANMMFNLSSKLNKIVTFGTNLSMNYSERSEPVMGGNEFMLLVYTAGPNYMPKLSDGSGRWTWRYNNPAWHNRNPEQALAYGSVIHPIYSLAAQTYVDVNISKDLVFEAKGAVNYDGMWDRSHENALSSYFYSDNTLAATVTGYNVGVQNNFGQNILTTFYSTLNYTKKISDHNINALVGYSQEANNYRYLKAFRQQFPTTKLAELNAGSTTNQWLQGSSEDWAMQSVFGRVGYDFKGKYLLEGNFRYDGSSRIYKDQRWGLFPSISAGWRLSKENFMQQFSWIDNLKLRASLGKLGNQNIGLYPYQSILNLNSYAYGSTVDQGVAVTRLVDKTLRWETTSVTDFGVDFSMKNGLLSLTADWFNKVTDDILYGIDIPASIGLDPPTVNYAKMKNTGFEIELGHTNKIGELKYNVNFNLSAYKNEVLKVKAPSYGQTTIQEGLPWNSYYLTEWIGIFQDQAEIDASPKQPYNPKPGDLKFKDQNGDKVIDSKDRVVVDGAFPKFYYGGSINLTWKSFDLSAFFQGVQGQKYYVNGWGIDPFIQGCPPTVDFEKNAWTPENKSNTYPAMYRSDYGPVSGTPSTYYLKDASYFRLKNLLIGYSLPSELIHRIGMKNLRVFVSGDNLATITKYPYADPERTGSGQFQTYPQLRTYTIGLNVKF
ncbi:MAG TPA: TonB-dependent receptor [Prolixibacteraceae bacterium]|nr:TonB-dependent receptor [Prolixibacteraceae bacterium]